MTITPYTGGFTQTNGYLVETPAGNFLIDAPEGIRGWLEQNDKRVTDVLLTHQHYDHVMDAAALRESGVKIHAFAPYSDQLTLEAAARAWGMPIRVEPYTVDAIFEVDRPLKIAGLEIGLAHVPGHASDSVVFHLADQQVVFSGDTLFADSIGRTDLPGGDTRELLEGIARHLLTMPPDTQVLPGHGPATTIGREAERNLFLR